MTNRTPNHRAIATKASIQTLLALAEVDGHVRILVESRHACEVIRRKIYAHRAQLRKSNEALTGVATSSYDGFTFPFGELGDDSGKWWFEITDSETIEFELVLPDDHEPVIGMDWIDSDVPQVGLEHAEVEFQNSVDEYGAEYPPRVRMPPSFPPDDDIPF